MWGRDPFAKGSPPPHPLPLKLLYVFQWVTRGSQMRDTGPQAGSSRQTPARQPAATTRKSPENAEPPVVGLPHRGKPTTGGRVFSLALLAFFKGKTGQCRNEMNFQSYHGEVHAEIPEKARVTTLPRILRCRRSWKQCRLQAGWNWGRGPAALRGPGFRQAAAPGA